MEESQLEEGIFTVSTGNFGQAVAWMAALLNVPCHVIVPDHVPEAKLSGVRRRGGHVMREPWSTWWSYIEGVARPQVPGVFIHPEGHDQIIAGMGPNI